MLLSYRNQSTDFCYKLIDWFLYDYNIGLIWVAILKNGNATSEN